MSKNTSKPGFNYPIHAFRGFAILNVVAIHAFAFVFFYVESSGQNPGWALTLAQILNGVLFHDATIYFTLISGILFAIVLQQRGYKRFFKSKFLYVFLPYLFFTLVLTAIDFKNFADWLGFYPGSFSEYLSDAGKNLLLGTANLTYWYIPVLFVLYALTPFLARLVQHQGATWLKVGIILAPLICSRVWPEIRWTNFVYFIGVYLVGIYFGTYYEKTISLTRQYLWPILATAVVTSIGVIAAYKVPEIGVTQLSESFWYVQKIAMAALVLLWFDNTLQTVPRWLDSLGNNAFALYFIHTFFLSILVSWLFIEEITIDSGGTLVLFLGTSLVIALTGSYLVIILGKKLLGRYSRYVLGA